MPLHSTPTPLSSLNYTRKRKEESLLKRFEVEPKITLDDLGGYTKVKKKMIRLAGKALYNGAAHTVILYGPPGTGKSTLPEALAGTLKDYYQKIRVNVRLYRISPADIKSSVYAESVKKIKAVITEAEKAAKEGNFSIIIVDEIESLLGRRDRSGTSLDADVVSAFLSTTDYEKPVTNPAKGGVLLVFTTNQEKLVDEAVFSRAEVIYVGPPATEEERKEILEKIIKNMRAPEEVKQKLLEPEIFELLVKRTSGYTPRDLKKVVASLVDRTIPESPAEQIHKKLYLQNINRKSVIRSINEVTPSALYRLHSEVPERGFEEIPGYRRVKEHLKGISFMIKAAEDAEKLYGVTPKTVLLFAGPDYSTMEKFMKGLAKDLNGRYVEIDVINFLSSFVTESEKETRNAIRNAMRGVGEGPAVLHIRNIDKLLYRENTGTYQRTFEILMGEIRRMKEDPTKKVVIIFSTDKSPRENPILYDYLSRIIDEEVSICFLSPEEYVEAFEKEFSNARVLEKEEVKSLAELAASELIKRTEKDSRYTLWDIAEVYASIVGRSLMKGEEKITPETIKEIIGMYYPPKSYTPWYEVCQYSGVHGGTAGPGDNQ